MEVAYSKVPYNKLVHPHKSKQATLGKQFGAECKHLEEEEKKEKKGHCRICNKGAAFTHSIYIRTVSSYALSFYRSQNVLCWSKFFEPAQKFIYILFQSQTFCARQKINLHSAKLFFVPAQKFLKRP